ncbi:hypothetical protein D3C76_911600 [compost metagenome]
MGPRQGIDHHRRQGQQTILRIALDQQQQVVFQRQARLLQRADQVGAERFELRVFL